VQFGQHGCITVAAHANETDGDRHGERHGVDQQCQMPDIKRLLQTYPART
jgi:hypothetical protein